MGRVRKVFSMPMPLPRPAAAPDASAPARIRPRLVPGAAGTATSTGQPPAPARAREQRRFPRAPLARTVKLQRSAPACYVDAEGLDASAGGVLVRVEGSTLPHPGEHLRVGISHRHRGGLMLADELVDATVVRQLRFGQAGYVAIAFDQPVFLNDAG